MLRLLLLLVLLVLLVLLLLLALLALTLVWRFAHLRLPGANDNRRLCQAGCRGRW